jgi:ketosteroid isomerase-like protein
MPTETDVATVRRIYAALAAQDLATVAECFHPDAVWHIPGSNALSGTHHGWPAIRGEIFARQGPLSDGTFRARLLDLAVGGEFVVAVVHATAQRGDHRLDQTVCQLMRVEDGKIREIRGHYADTTALDAFWNPDTDDGSSSSGR